MSIDIPAVIAKLNEAENAFGRAMGDMKRGNIAGAKADTETGIAFAHAAYAMICDCIEGGHPTPTPTPTPTPDVTTPIHLRPFTPLILTPAQMDAWTEPTSEYTPRPSMEGALRFFGNSTGEFVYDDPLLYPGQPGRAHLHEPIGVQFDAFSTLDSLMAVEDNRWVGGPTMRPVFWMPAAIDDETQQAKVCDNGALYYKQSNSSRILPPGFPADFPMEEIKNIAGSGTNSEKQARIIAFLTEYHTKIGTVWGRENVPNGMCMIGGHHMDGTPGDASFDLSVPGHGSFKAKTLTQAVKKWRDKIGDPAAETPVGTSLREFVGFPNNYNGATGSVDYRSHMAKNEFGGRNYYIHNMPPASHPRTFLSISMFRTFTQREGEPPISRQRYSSDAPAGTEGREAGDTLHGDYASIWPEPIRSTWYREIIQKGVSTSTSGNTISYGGIRAQNPNHTLKGWKGAPRFVPIPSRPAPPAHGEPGHYHH